MKVRRTDDDFRWLYEHMAKEFPFILLPPMMIDHDKNFDSKTITLTKKYFDKFINECVRHPELKNSLCLEIFLMSQTKEEFAMRCKDIQTFFNKNLLISKGVTKKSFDVLNNDGLKLYTTTTGIVELKISPTLRNYLKSAEGQYYHYDILFERLAKLHTVYDKYHKKLIYINTKIKETFSEFQTTAVKFNSAKPFRTRFDIVEDTVYSSIVSYFDSYGKIIR